MNAPRSFLLAACAAALAGGCSYDPAGPARFLGDGQLIALSGGDAGAEGACATCHGLAGEGDGNLTPRLAGLDEGYLVRQLTAYAEGLRQHTQMRAFADRLNTTQRLAVSRYYAAMPGWGGCAAAAPASAEPARGAELWDRGDPSRGLASCASCHGGGGEGQAGNPALAGQSAAYLAGQLALWTEGRRRSDPDSIMARISQRLGPADTAAVADHAARLPGGFPNRESPATCPPARRADPRNGA